MHGGRGKAAGEVGRERASGIGGGEDLRLLDAGSVQKRVAVVQTAGIGLAGLPYEVQRGSGL